jgi:pimeloyl-ACP methyl ester carboxylesterase
VTGLHRLHYTDWGPKKAKRVIVCAHGYSGNARDFDYLAAALAGRGTRVVCLDIAGRGDSDWLSPALSYNFAQFLSDIHELIGHLRVKQVDWVGTSMGGLLGMLLASQPGSPVRRLVMNDIGAFLPADALQAIARNLGAPARFASLDEVEAHMRHTHRDWGDLPDDKWRHFAVHGSRPVGNGFRLHYDPRIAQLVQPFPLAPGIFMWDAWYRVRCPVLLIRGENSEIFPVSVAETMLEVKPDAELVEFPGCGHVPSLMVQPHIAAIGNFLGVTQTKAQWHQRPSSSSPASSRTRTPSPPRSPFSGTARPASSPT